MKRYADLPADARTRGREIVLVCRSGNRSLLAGDVMQAMGFTSVVSLRTGLRGWNDADLPLVAAVAAPTALAGCSTTMTPAQQDAREPRDGCMRVTTQAMERCGMLVSSGGR